MATNLTAFQRDDLRETNRQLLKDLSAQPDFPDFSVVEAAVGEYAGFSGAVYLTGFEEHRDDLERAYVHVHGVFLEYARLVDEYFVTIVERDSL